MPTASAITATWPNSTRNFPRPPAREVVVSFTPHLMPMNRGILSTIYVRGRAARRRRTCMRSWRRPTRRKPFVHVLPFGKMPQTRHVRGSNMTFIGVAADRDRRPRDHRLGARQPDQGRLGSGGAEHEPDARLSRDDGAGAGGAVSVELLPGVTQLLPLGVNAL